MRNAARQFCAALALLLAVVAPPAMTQSLESVVMPGQVIQGHAKWEGQCRKCHTPFNKSGQTALCLDCHKETAADVQRKGGYHGREKERECRVCHTDHKGREAKIVLLDEQRFDHAQSDFALREAHVKPKCGACHVPRTLYRKTPTACNGCHRKDDKHKGGLGALCADCHSEASWKDAKFDHNKTRYMLKAKHADVACKDCHAGERFKGVPQDCFGCHKKDDTHKGLYGAKCETCHFERDWKIWTFNHEREAKFALRDKHRSAKCESCHKKPRSREKLATTCDGCHREDDVHKGRLGQKCDSCHGERSWKTSSFEHETDSKFKLRGKHVSVKCDGCHRDKNTFKEKLPQTCIGCHRKDDERAKHRGRYGEKCETCHTEKVWIPSTFDHGRDTRYLLRQKHAKVKCDDCHRGDLYRDKLQEACIACHEKDDKHKGQLSKKCESCHGEQDWKKTTFDHNRTKFPLLGRHAPAECKGCHSGFLYRDAKTTCFACHDKNDTHKRRLGPRCEDCHNARDWKIWDFDHARTKYRLDGAHVKAACLACHVQPVKDKIRLASTCAACHGRDDAHSGRFGNQCERCHVSSAWPTIRPRAGFGSSPGPGFD